MPRKAKQKGFASLQLSTLPGQLVKMRLSAGRSITRLPNTTIFKDPKRCSQLSRNIQLPGVGQKRPRATGHATKCSSISYPHQNQVGKMLSVYPHGQKQSLRHCIPVCEIYGHHVGYVQDEVDELRGII